MKTVWRALTLMADSVHYFSHNVAFFFFFSFFLPGTTCTKTQSHIHLQPTFLQPGKTFHKSTPSEHPTVIPVSPPSRFSYPGLVTLSSACSSIKWTYSVSREGKLEILLNMCVWVTTIGASDWEQLIQLVWKQLWLPFVPHKTIWIIQINVFFGWKLVCDGAPRITCFSLESPYRSAFSLDRLVHSHYRWRTTGISKLHWT